MAPTLEETRTLFGENAELALALMTDYQSDMATWVADYITEERVRKMLHPPTGDDLRLLALDVMLDHVSNGIESAIIEGMDYIDYDHERWSFQYINMGDTYDLTLILCDGVFAITSWGDMIEELEGLHKKEEEE